MPSRKLEKLLAALIPLVGILEGHTVAFAGCNTPNGYDLFGFPLSSLARTVNTATKAAWDEPIEEICKKENEHSASFKIREIAYGEQKAKELKTTPEEDVNAFLEKKVNSYQEYDIRFLLNSPDPRLVESAFRYHIESGLKLSPQVGAVPYDQKVTDPEAEARKYFEKTITEFNGRYTPQVAQAYSDFMDRDGNKKEDQSENKDFRWLP